MASIDWIGLKDKFILGSCNSLREFAELQNLKYNGNFMKKTKGWNDERVAVRQKKSCKIIEKTIEKVAERVADRNSKHLMVWDKILNKIDKLANMDKIEVPTKQGDVIEIDVTHKHLAELSSAMDRVQKGQRLAEGLDKEDKANDAVAKSNERIMRIAELLNSPVNDRKIDDFEDDE